MSAEMNGLGDARAPGSPVRTGIMDGLKAVFIRPNRAIVASHLLPVRSALKLRDERHALQNRTRDEHLAVVSHELRNALGVIRNASLLLQPKHTGTISVEDVRALIDRQLAQLNRHVDDLVNVTPMAKDGSPLQFHRTDLCEVARHSIDAFSLELARRGQNLTVTMPLCPLWLLADGGRLEQVLGNLMINAAKYTPDGGKITLCLEAHGEFASVRIGDTGIGIAPEMLAKVFGLFVQVDGAAQYSEGGRGIGLAVARNFVEMHGGRLNAASAGLGMGSEFTILLPILDPH